MALSKPLEIFSCPICSETFKSPKILPCLHTFCESCIHEFILSIGNKKDNKISEFACPICRTGVRPLNSEEDIEKWSNSLQDNTSMATLMALSTGDKTQECHACKRSNEKSNAKFWCKICEEALCEECNQMHSRMKLSYTHDVVEIEEYSRNETGKDLNGISKQCTMHPSKEIEMFCSLHREPCCILCLVSEHFGCTGVKSIEEVLSDDNNYESLPAKLEKLKDATVILLRDKEKHKSEFTSNSVNEEEEAAKFIKLVKDNLDGLFLLFKKQLHIFRDEQNTSNNIRLRLLEQFVKSLEHWINVTTFVEEFGSKTQFLIQVETMKGQINESITKIRNSFKNDKTVTVKFNKNDLVQQLETANELGTFSETINMLVGQTAEIYKQYKVLGISCNLTYETINLNKLQSFHFQGSNITCGTSISVEYLVLGDEAEKKLHLLKNGTIINSTAFTGNPKRLCYDYCYSRVFISCHTRELYGASCLLFRNEIMKPEKINFVKEFVGSIYSDNENIFLVVNNAIKQFPNSLEGELTTSFATNTTCELNGMDILEDNIIFTTKDKEIKRATLNGREIFCYKNETIKNPECLAILPSGLILFVDRHDRGSLHLLSADGKKHRTLLANFEKIENPMDIWLDKDKETVYIAGGEYIEVYELI